MSLDIWLSFESKHGTGGSTAFDGNYTHNVTPMWSKAGVYDALYNSSGKKAKEILPELVNGILGMRNNPDEYKKLNPDNGWGDYDSALKFLRNFAKSCNEYPETIIGIWK